MLAGTPSNHRAFESSLQLHLRRPGHDGSRYCVNSCRPECSYGPVLAYRRKRRNRVRGPLYIGTTERDISDALFAPKAITAPYLPIAVKGETEYVARGIRAEGISSGLPPSRSGVPNRRGRSWRGTAPYCRKSRLRASRHASEVAYINISHEIGAIGNAISAIVAVRNALTGPYLRIAVKGATKYVAYGIPAEGHSSWLPPTRRGVASQRGRVRRSMASHRMETRPSSRKRAIKRSCLRK